MSGAMVPEVVGVKYREAGKLEATVASDAVNHFDFQLTSDGTTEH